MGVPGFFSWLLKNYQKNKIISYQIDGDVDILYIDANCAFHPQCFKVLGHYKNSLSLEKLENKMIKRIINFLIYLIGFVNPKKEVYIAVDGVAPMAKINQQRKRRYKTVIDNVQRNEINSKYDKEVIDVWNNTTITPGTSFMEKLHQKLVQFIKSNELELNIKYTYSSYHTIGEGEHKILQDIRSKVHDNKDDIYVIYGLDADLFFLSMGSQKNNIYLLREELFSKSKVHNEDDDFMFNILTDVTEDLNYVSVDETKDCINSHFHKVIRDKLEDPHKELNDNYINDFIILCFLLGNDFLPNIPSLNIKHNGLNFIINIYVSIHIQTNEFLLVNKEINYKFFTSLIKEISMFEENYFLKIYPKYQEANLKRKCSSNDPYDIEIWKIDNLKNIDTSDQPKNVGQCDPLEWKYDYYYYYFKTSNNHSQHVNDVCHQYLKGIIWTIHYYFDKCISYEWQYPYFCAPFISDFHHYLVPNKNNQTINNDINKVKVFQKDTLVITPLVQLLAVIPPQYNKILPYKYIKLMESQNSPILDYFPTHVKLDYLYKDVLYKCMPFIPNVNMEEFCQAVKGISHDKKEIERNQLLDNIVFNFMSSLN